MATINAKIVVKEEPYTFLRELQMPGVGVAELMILLSEIVRRIREGITKYAIVSRGRPVVTLRPLERPSEAQDVDQRAWQELERLGKRIGRGWRSPKTSLELLSESRRRSGEVPDG